MTHDGVDWLEGREEFPQKKTIWFLPILNSRIFSTVYTEAHDTGVEELSTVMGIFMGFHAENLGIS